MAIVLRAVGAVDRGAAAIAPGLPAGTAAGDYLLMVCETNNQAITASGWTEITGHGSPITQGTQRITLLYRRATGTDPTTTNDSGDHQVARIVGFTGVKATGDGFNVSATGTEATVDTSGSIPGATTTLDGCYVLACCGTDRDFTESNAQFGTWANASLTSGQELMDDCTAAGNGGGFGVYGGFMDTAGTYNATTVTLANASAKAMWTGALEPESAPTTQLDAGIPNENADTTDTTPTLRFAGVDLNGDDIRYQVQVSNDNLFNASTTIESYSSANNDGFFAQNSSSVLGCSQRILGDGRTLTSYVWNLKKTGTPGNVVCKVYAEASEKPTGAALATSDALTPASVGTSAADIEFTFPSPATLTSGTKYCITVEAASGDASNFYSVGEDTTSATAVGQSATLFGGTWNTQSTGTDFSFTAKHSPASIMLDKLSGTDTGFADVTNGADTDPFATGDIIEFTVQDADVLTPGTYYWRARGIDPTGGNTYGAWAPSKIFVVVPPRPAVTVGASQAAHRAASW